MIYSVEDDESIRELIIYTLISQGFKADGVASGAELFEKIEYDVPELVLLDIMLPKESGIDILKRLKNSARYKDVPVIMVSAKGSEYDKVVGLDQGADDYISKPFGMMELVSRVKAVLRRTSKENNTNIIVGNIVIDQDARTVKAFGEPISLTMKEFDLLIALAKNKKIVLSREKLLEMVWGYETELETRTLDVHINTLRTKLKGAESQIRTVRGVGYMLLEE